MNEEGNVVKLNEDSIETVGILDIHPEVIDVDFSEVNDEEEVIKITEEQLSEMDEKLEELKNELPKLDDIKRDIVDNLQSSIKENEEKGNTEAVEKLTALLDQILDSDELNRLKNSEFMKYRHTGYSKDKLSEVKRKAKNKLEKNKSYIFKEIDTLEKTLKANLPDAYKKGSVLFLFVFFKFIAEKKLVDNAIFVSNVITNIHNLNVKEHSVHDKFKSNVIDIINKLL